MRFDSDRHAFIRRVHVDKAHVVGRRVETLLRAIFLGVKHGINQRRCNDDAVLYEMLPDHPGNGIVRYGPVRSSGTGAHALVLLYVRDRLPDFVDSLIDVHSAAPFVVFHCSYSCQHSVFSA